MQNILNDFAAGRLVKKADKENWQNYHYCLGCLPRVKLSISRYLTWLIRNIPDHFMNLVVCMQLPSERTDVLMESAWYDFLWRHVLIYRFEAILLY